MTEVIFAMGRPACLAFPRLKTVGWVSRDYARCQFCNSIIRPGTAMLVAKTDKPDEGPTWAGSEEGHEYILCNENCRLGLVAAARRKAGLSNEPVLTQ